MELDPIDVRMGNYFEYNRTVKEILLEDLLQLNLLLDSLKPIPLQPKYLTRLNFVTVTNHESVRHYQKYTAGIYFNLFPKRDGSMSVYINTELKLPHIAFIHQLQNVYYDLTGDILRRMPPAEIVLFKTITPIPGKSFEKRSGPGKYRSIKKD